LESGVHLLRGREGQDNMQATVARIGSKQLLDARIGEKRTRECSTFSRGA
jgi:hypothetical protein